MSWVRVKAVAPAVHPGQNCDEKAVRVRRGSSQKVPGGSRTRASGLQLGSPFPRPSTQCLLIAVLFGDMRTSPSCPWRAIHSLFPQRREASYSGGISGFPGQMRQMPRLPKGAALPTPRDPRNFALSGFLAHYGAPGPPSTVGVS